MVVTCAAISSSWSCRRLFCRSLRLRLPDGRCRSLPADDADRCDNVPPPRSWDTVSSVSNRNDVPFVRLLWAHVVGGDKDGLDEVRGVRSAAARVSLSEECLGSGAEESFVAVVVVLAAAAAAAAVVIASALFWSLQPLLLVLSSRVAPRRLAVVASRTGCEKLPRVPKARF